MNSRQATRAHQVPPQHRQRIHEVPSSFVCLGPRSKENIFNTVRVAKRIRRTPSLHCLHHGQNLFLGSASCWTVWMPTSLLLTWDEFTHKLRSDNEFKERVDMARKHMNELGRGFRDSFPEAVKTSDDLAISIIGRGRLLSPKDLRFDGQLFTPSQLSLAECNMKLSTLSGASIEGSRPISNGYASRCVDEIGFSPQLGLPQKNSWLLPPSRLWFLTRFGHSLRHDVAIHLPRPFDPGFLVADDGSNDLVCEVYSTKSVTSSTLQLTPESALFSGLAEPALEKATEDHVTSKSLNGTGPTLDTLRSRALTVARSKNKGTQRCGLPEKESGPTSEPKAKPKRKTAFGPCPDSSSSENGSSGSSSSMGRSSQRSLVLSATTPKGSPPPLSRAKSSSRSLVLTEPPASFTSKGASGDRENLNVERSLEGKLSLRLGAVNLVPCTPFTKVVRDDDAMTWIDAGRGRQVHSARTRRTEGCENTRVLDPKAQHQGRDDGKD